MAKYDLDYERIGKNIQKERTRKGLTQSELASLLGISKTYVSQIETGVRHPSLANYVAIAQELGVSMDALTGISSDKGKTAYVERLSQVVADCDPLQFQIIEEMAENIKKAMKKYRESLDKLNRDNNTTD